MAFCVSCGKQLAESAAFCDHCGAKQSLSALSGVAVGGQEEGAAIEPRASGSQKSQTLATVLCALLGWLGVHRFYLGPIWLGVLYLLFFCTGIPALVAMVETIVLAFSSQESWARKYNGGNITAPTHILVKILALVLPFFMLIAFIGILAAISLPAYQDYQNKAKAHAVLSALQKGKLPLTEFLARQKAAPLDDSVRKEIQSAVGQDRNVAEVESFAYGQYGDVGARLALGKKEGKLYLVTRDGGASWQCLAVDLPARALPRNCEAAGQIDRPEIPKPAPKIGLWEAVFYHAALQACSQRAMESGDASGPAACRCILDKAAANIPQEEAERGEMSFKERLHDYALDCRSRMGEEEDKEDGE